MSFSAFLPISPINNNMLTHFLFEYCMAVVFFDMQTTLERFE